MSDLTLTQDEMILRDNEVKLIFKPSLHILIKHDEENDRLYCIDDELGLDINTESLTDFLNDLTEEISFIYKNYMIEDDFNLSPKAKELKCKYLNRVTIEHISLG